MLIYLFKGANGEIETANEITAHNWLRNRNSWQRQDLVYMGATDDAEINKAQSSIKEKSKELAFNDIPSAKLLKDQIELATLKKEDTRTLELELKVLQGAFNAVISDRSGNVINDEHDLWRLAVINKSNELQKSVLSNVKPDAKVLPRNFNQLTSNFSGENTQPADNINLPR